MYAGEGIDAILETIQSGTMKKDNTRALKAGLGKWGNGTSPSLIKVRTPKEEKSGADGSG